MKIEIKEGQIVLAPFRFSEQEERKLRPCLVLSTTAFWFEAVAITGQKLAKAFDHEVVLTEDESLAIGLAKQSKLDFTKRDKIPLHEVKRVLGSIDRLPRRRLGECFEAARAAGLVDD
jgi:mRNA-degrading endonuclease toxin of MazEF toxin-antitoxin module